MRTFYIASACFILFIAWLLNKPIPTKPQVARAFTSAEIDYLEKSFNYAMDNLKEGEFLDWSVAAVNGRISVGKPFTSNQKATCRDFVEVALTSHAQKVDSGVACNRGVAEGWCRVYGTSPQSCALEETESAFVKQARYAIMQGNQNVDALMSKRVNVNTNGLVPKMPSVSMPGVGPIDMPALPDIKPGDLRPPMPWDPPKK